MIKAISFDLDDTLWYAAPALVRAETLQYAWIEQHAPRIAERYSLEALRRARHELAARRPEIAHDFTELRRVALLEHLRECAYPEHLAAEGIAVFLRERSQVEFYDDALPVLRRLAPRYALIALTNGNADLDLVGIADLFVTCVSPAEAGVRKPDPRLFQAGLAHAGVSAAEAVHVGDQPLYDIEGAHRATMRSIWLNRNAAEWPPDYAPATAQITSLSELERVLAELSQPDGEEPRNT
ncbi:MAG: HAD family hydrolase [Gammaproteobacteria bacterium]